MASIAESLPSSLLDRSDIPASQPGLLTCITCRVGFRDADLQREHYKSDWHRYNLKRKIVQLPPVTVENFAERVAAQEAQQADSNKDTTQYCTICKKSFGNEKAFQSHVVSKKHSAMVKEVSKQECKKRVSSKIQEALSKDLKSKCSVGEGSTSKASSSKGPATSKKLPESPGPIMKAAFIGKGNRLGSAKEVEKMELDDDDDSDSWEEIEGIPIPVNFCLFCNYESEDIEANLEHMSLHHSFFIPDMEYCIDIEGLMDYLGSKVGEGMVCLWCNEKGRQFYDVLAVQQHMRDKGHCKLLHDADAAFEYSDFYDYSSSYPDDADSVNPEEMYQPEVLQFNDNMELVLPSGKSLGHRALKIYYKQYVRPGSQLMAKKRKEIRKNRILSQYKAIGYDQTALAVAQQKYRDQKYIKMVKDKYVEKVTTRGNKTLQTHFRCQVMF